MICARVNDAPEGDFVELLRKTRDVIFEHFKTTPAELKKIKAVEFETLVCKSAEKAAKGTIFEGKIEQTGIHAFPDIIARKYYGIEVKTTTADKWVSTGNSVLESTRQDSVERIYLFFAKFGGTFDMKFRLYQECLYEIAVTHSPRYQINMDLAIGQTIFDKLDIAYDELRHLEKPVRPIVDYYRKLTKPGEETWWMESSDSQEATLKPIVSMWKYLDAETQKNIRSEAMALFPEMFSNKMTKFQRLLPWLAAKHGVVIPAVRDIFTAGGQIQHTIKGVNYKKLPKIFYYLEDNFSTVLGYVKKITPADAKHYWQIEEEVGQYTIVDQWCDSVIENASLALKRNRQFIVHLLAEKLGKKGSSSLVKEEMSKYGLDFD
ncbi:MAG: hypothetical protein KJ915_10500 [Candidatus Omnitrophica bacterium]|nr:hypothetical protein [Candidatus Omnitrophota bacterium]